MAEKTEQPSTTQDLATDNSVDQKEIERVVRKFVYRELKAQLASREDIEQLAQELETLRDIIAEMKTQFLRRDEFEIVELSNNVSSAIFVKTRFKLLIF